MSGPLQTVDLAEEGHWKAMPTLVNRRITLASRPVGFPRMSDFRLDYSRLPSAAAGEVLVRALYLSLDPYMRGRMNGGDPNARPVAIGEVMPGAAVALVLESDGSELRAGDLVEGMLGWQEYAVAPARELRKIDPRLAPISTALGVLGMPGLAAYFGLLDIADPQTGETVVVSGAAGAVGTIVGQVAKIRGSRVVGVAGSDAKISWLIDDLGFDAAFNYRAPEDFDGELEKLCPDGVDVYFDNVGGAVTDAVMRRINTGARIAVCGQASQYNLEAPELGPRWLGRLILKQAKVQGFLVSVFAERFPKDAGNWPGGCCRGSSSIGRTSPRASKPRRRPSSACCKARTWASSWCRSRSSRSSEPPRGPCSVGGAGRTEYFADLQRRALS